MDYMTLHINKRFLLVVLVLSLIVGGGYGLYRYAYTKGINDTVTYFFNQLQSQKSSGTNQFAPAPVY